MLRSACSTGCPGLPVSEHPELFEQVHAQLSEVLGELDSGPVSLVRLAAERADVGRHEQEAAA